MVEYKQQKYLARAIVLLRVDTRGLCLWAYCKKEKEMKKFLTILLVGILAVCCVAMSACKKPDTDGAATYKMYQLTAEGTDYALGDPVPGLIVSYEPFELTENFLVLEFKADGTAVSTQNGEASPVTITWTKSGNTYTITQTMEGDQMTMTATVDGEYLLMEVDTVLYKLKKA